MFNLTALYPHPTLPALACFGRFCGCVRGTCVCELVQVDSSPVLRTAAETFQRNQRGKCMRSPAMTLPGDLATRCPYCVTGDQFCVMETHDQTNLCSRCGHMVRLSDR